MLEEKKLPCGGCSQVGITALANQIKVVKYPKRNEKVGVAHSQKKEVESQLNSW